MFKQVGNVGITCRWVLPVRLKSAAASECTAAVSVAPGSAADDVVAVVSSLLPLYWSCTRYRGYSAWRCFQAWPSWRLWAPGRVEERGSHSDPADEVLCFVTEEEATLFFLCSKKASCDFGNSVRQFFMTPAQSCCRAKSLTRASHRLPAAAFSFNNFNHLLSDPSIQKLTGLVCMKTDNCFSL